jgi:hypothetical protein
MAVLGLSNPNITALADREMGSICLDHHERRLPLRGSTNALHHVFVLAL